MTDITTSCHYIHYQECGFQIAMSALWDVILGILVQGQWQDAVIFSGNVIFS